MQLEGHIFARFILVSEQADNLIPFQPWANSANRDGATFCLVRYSVMSGVATWAYLRKSQKASRKCQIDQANMTAPRRAACRPLLRQFTRSKE